MPGLFLTTTGTSEDCSILLLLSKCCQRSSIVEYPYRKREVVGSNPTAGFEQGNASSVALYLLEQGYFLFRENCVAVLIRFCT